MQKKGLNVFEIIYLRCKGRSDACRSFVFQDQKGKGYPKRFLRRSEARHYQEQKGSGTAQVFDSNTSPEVLSSFIMTELHRYRDERDRLLADKRVWVRNGRKFPRLMRYSNARRIMKKTADDLSKAQTAKEEADKKEKKLLEEYKTQWLEAEKKLLEEYKTQWLEAEKKAVSNQTPDLQHIEVLFARREFSRSSSTNNTLSLWKNRENNIRSEEESLREKMKDLLQKRYAHRCLRISYYYQCAQKRQPMLPAISADPDELTKELHIDVFGSLDQKTQPAAQAAPANPGASSASEKEADYGS